jgi:hypothetical protein
VARCILHSYFVRCFYSVGDNRCLCCCHSSIIVSTANNSASIVAYIGASPLSISKNLTMLSPFSCSSSMKPAIILLRGASTPVGLVIKYATPMPLDIPFLKNSAKCTVPFSLLSSVVKRNCPRIAMPSSVRRVMVPRPLFVVFMVSVEFGTVIVVFPLNVNVTCFPLVMLSGMMSCDLPTFTAVSYCPTAKGSFDKSTLRVVVEVLPPVVVSSTGNDAAAVGITELKSVSDVASNSNGSMPVTLTLTLRDFTYAYTDKRSFKVLSLMLWY